MSTIVIEITVPGGSPVDYTGSCIFQRTRFSQQMNAVAGDFEVWVRDPTQVLSFVTGSQIAVTVDGKKTFGGYVTQVEFTNMFEAVATDPPEEVETRVFILRGADYNIIFDRRVWRNEANYLAFIDLSAFTTDGALLRELVDNFADLADFDSSGIDDCATIATGDVVEQGTKIRDRFQVYSFFGGSIYYINADKEFIYKQYETVEKRWGFSDVPNYAGITASPDEYQGSTIGYRSITATEDASYMVNDALIWGGSKFAGAGGTVFARNEDATSISDHYRWQVAETHFGERLYSGQDQVDARALVIIDGPPGADVYGQQKGLKNPQWQFQFTWFSADVPRLSGSPDHLIPGDIVTILMETFGITQLLPLRTLRTSFPDAFETDGTHLVQFDGTFGLQISDPFTLWRYLLTNQTRVEQTVITSVDESSTTTVFGAEFSGEPSPAPDGVETVFTIPFGYIQGSTSLFFNGLFQRRGTDYTESDPAAGEITLAFLAPTGSNLILDCNTLDS